jgi:outer membrane lipoprotein carrier protein
MRTLLLLGLALMAVAELARPATEAQSLLAAVEQHHRSLRDLEARFVQTYASGALGQQTVERGLFQLKRPGKMRWEYRVPDQKLFVSDGHEVYFYVPADRQVIIHEQASLQGLAFRVLAGEVDLAGDFTALLVRGAQGTTRLRLEPKDADAEVARLVLDVDAGFRIVGLEILDLQGNMSRFRFEGLRENRGLPDRLFRFEIPPGVEVVRG